MIRQFKLSDSADTLFLISFLSDSFFILNFFYMQTILSPVKISTKRKSYYFEYKKGTYVWFVIGEQTMSNGRLRK